MSAHGGPPRHRENWKLGCKVYVGNLSEGASKNDIEGAFSKFGPLRNCWVARNPPGFAFVEFEDGRDAEDACRQLDGTRIAGGRIKAEMSHGRARRGRGAGPPSFGGRGPAPYPYGGSGRSSSGGYGSSRSHYNGHDASYGSSHHGGPRGGAYGGHGGHHGSYMDRSRDRYPPPGSRGSISGKDYRHYSRSRSNSLGKSPPPPPRATARPRTPPSRTPSIERH